MPAPPPMQVWRDGSLTAWWAIAALSAAASIMCATAVAAAILKG